MRSQVVTQSRSLDGDGGPLDPSTQVQYMPPPNTAPAYQSRHPALLPHVFFVPVRHRPEICSGVPHASYCPVGAGHWGAISSGGLFEVLIRAPGQTEELENPRVSSGILSFFPFLNTAGILRMPHLQHISRNPPPHTLARMRRNDTCDRVAVPVLVSHIPQPRRDPDVSDIYPDGQHFSRLG